LVRHAAAFAQAVRKFHLPTSSTIGLSKWLDEHPGPEIPRSGCPTAAAPRRPPHAIAEPQLRLKIKLELVVRECAPHSESIRAAPALGRTPEGTIDSAGRRTSSLEQRKIGICQQLIDIRGIAWRDRNPRARADIQKMRAISMRSATRPACRRRFPPTRGSPHCAKDRDEFVAPEAVDLRRIPGDFSQALATS